MADQPKKPRNIKDLKARLGRTISPQQQQQQQGQGAGAVPPPNVGQQPAPGAPTPQPPGAGPVPPPGAGSAPPPPGIPSAPAGAPGGDVAPPPVLQQQQQPQQQRASADPFAASQAPAGAQGAGEVRLVIDEKPVQDSEVGRKQRGRSIILMAVASVIGIGLGFGAGSTMYEGKLYNMAIQDGRDIYEKIKESSKTVEQANKYINSALGAAKGKAGGEGPRVDYQAIEKLRALEKPFDAHYFSDKRYKAFKPETVNNLFEYFLSVNRLWDGIQGLAGRTLPQDRRERLDKAAKAAGDTTSMQTGCVPDVVEKRWICGLVYVHPPEEQSDEPVTELQVSTTKRGRSFQKILYMGQEDFAENPSDYVILTHTKRSLGVLGESANLFAEYQRDLMGINETKEKTLELQGKLKSSLAEVAALEEHFFAL